MAAVAPRPNDLIHVERGPSAGTVGRLDLDHRVAIGAEFEDDLRILVDGPRLARIGAGRLAFGQDDDPGAAFATDHHAAGELLLVEELEQGWHVDPRRVELG